MSIRPIDLQVLIPRASDTGKIQQNSDHQPVLQQQILSEEWQKLSYNRQHIIQNTNHSEGGRVTAEKESQEKQNKNKNRSKKQNSDTGCDALLLEESGNDPIRGHIIDIKT